MYGPLLEEASRRFPRARSEVILLPGQGDPNGHVVGEFLIPEAATRLRSTLEAEKTNDHFLIARSSGCNVVAELLATWEGTSVKRVVFWGPPPFWLYCDMFGTGKGMFYDKCAKTWVHVTKNIVQTTAPWESRLPSISCPVRLATGDRDNFCRPEYLKYIRACVANKGNFDFPDAVVNCPHSVTPELPCWSDYCEALFGWLLR